jgi:membrane-associated phospholipid phosphatase
MTPERFSGDSVTSLPSAKITPWFWLPALIALLLMFVIKSAGWDAKLFMSLNNSCQFAGDTFWIAMTTLGDGLVVCVLVLPLVRRKPELVWAFLLSWLLVALYVKGVKLFIDRPRPLTTLPSSDFHIIGAPYRFNSFPSGHAATAAMFAAIFCIFFKNGWLRVSMIVLALLIGLSRIAVGVHWVIDVLAGFFGGWLAAGLGSLLAMRFPFGTFSIAKIIFGVSLGVAAVFMLSVNHTDYPQAFKFQQAIAWICLICAFGDMCLWFRKLYREKKETIAS